MGTSTSVQRPALKRTAKFSAACQLAPAPANAAKVREPKKIVGHVKLLLLNFDGTCGRCAVDRETVGGVERVRKVAPSRRRAIRFIKQQTLEVIHHVVQIPKFVEQQCNLIFLPSTAAMIHDGPLVGPNKNDPRTSFQPRNHGVYKTVKST